jgi:ABC-type antimicrobial peptide transport system permease subunit
VTALEVIAATLLVLLVLAAILGPPLFADAASATNVTDAMKGMSARHLFGTDTLGRDVFARVMVAARPTLLMALAATLVGAVLGMLLGLATAAIRGRLSSVLTGLVGILVAFPPLLLAIFFAVVFGLGPRGVVLAVSAAFLPGFARLTETLSRSLAGRDYVAAARMLAIRPLTVARRHIMPNIAEPVIVYFAVHVGIAILALSGVELPRLRGPAAQLRLGIAAGRRTSADLPDTDRGCRSRRRHPARRVDHEPGRRGGWRHGLDWSRDRVAGARVPPPAGDGRVAGEVRAGGGRDPGQRSLRLRPGCRRVGCRGAGRLVRRATR